MSPYAKKKKEKNNRVAVPRCPQQLASHLLPRLHSWKPPAVAGRRSLHVRLPCKLGWNTAARPRKRVNHQRMCSLRGANTKRHAMHLCWCTFLQLPRYPTTLEKLQRPLLSQTSATFKDNDWRNHFNHSCMFCSPFRAHSDWAGNFPLTMA